MMNKWLVNWVKGFVKKTFDKADLKYHDTPFFYEYHLKPAARIGKDLAKKYGADEKVVEVALLLHDIGLTQSVENEEHGVTGARMVEEILRSKGCSQDFINKVASCVLKHSCKEHLPVSKEERIVATADALSHLTTPWFFIKFRFTNKSVAEQMKWTFKKVEEDYGKIQFHEEKENAKESLRFIKGIFENEN